MQGGQNKAGDRYATGILVRFPHCSSASAGFDFIPHVGAGLAQADESICTRGAS